MSNKNDDIDTKEDVYVHTSYNYDSSTANPDNSRNVDQVAVDTANNQTAREIADSRKVDRWYKIFGRQFKTLFIKDLIVMIRHPILLFLELAVPFLLFISILGDPLKLPANQEHHLESFEDPKFFSLDGDGVSLPNKLAYIKFPGDNIIEPIMSVIKERYTNGRRLEEGVNLHVYENESDELKNLLLSNPNSYWAVFSVVCKKNAGEADNQEIPGIPKGYRVCNGALEDEIYNMTYRFRVAGQYSKAGKYNDVGIHFYDPYVAEYLLENAILRLLTEANVKKAGINTSSISYIKGLGFQWFPDVQFYDSDTFNTMETAAPVILGVSAIFSFFAFTYNLVSEKQFKLRQSLHTVGMLDSAFWAANSVVALIIATVQSLLICITGVISGFNYFAKSPFLLTFYIIQIFFFTASTFSFLISALLSNVKATAFIIFLCILVFFIFGMLSTNQTTIYPGDSNWNPWYIWFSTHCAHAMYVISTKTFPIIRNGSAFENVGFTWYDSYTYVPENTRHTVAFSISQMIVCAACYLLFAAYLDIVIPAAHGSALPLWAPFTMDFWGLVKAPPPPPSHVPGYKKPQPLPEWDPDVLIEYNKLLAPLNSREYASVADAAIKIYDMTVIYKRGCSKRAGKKAVRNLSLHIPRNCVYALLGPNGAGKSTTMSVLTGSLKPSEGYVSIMDYSAQHQRDRISQLIGYSPQHDILWPDLTPAEHLQIFNDLRGINYTKDLESLEAAEEAAARAGIVATNNIYAKAAEERIARTRARLETEAASEKPGRTDDYDESDDETLGGNANPVTGDFIAVNSGNACACCSRGDTVKYIKLTPRIRLIRQRLEDVSLLDAINVPSKSLSGGMRRRLTIAISLVGNPSIVFLDEPSTGLDPVNVARLQSVIMRAKTGKTIVLTTHSMAEADNLSDRIAIIAHGILRCVGSSSRLKRRYGMGYRVDIECEFDAMHGKSDVLRIRDELVLPYCPQALLIGRTGGHLTLAIPRSITTQALHNFLSRVESSPLVKDWAIRQTTLEEVFIAISRHADKLLTQTAAGVVNPSAQVNSNN